MDFLKVLQVNQKYLDYILETKNSDKNPRLQWEILLPKNGKLFTVTVTFHKKDFLVKHISDKKQSEI